MTADTLRRAYAEGLCATAGVHLEPLVEAFARVPRERFLGAGPWQLPQPFDPSAPYRWTPDARLEHVYQDVAIALDPARQLNNGQPSAHARWIDAAKPTPGERVLHIGCGTGYYTAILAELVGPAGHVVAYELDPELASRARDSLAAWPQVRVETGDASHGLDTADVIYVNAGATHARPEWLAALAEGGRLLLPLTAHVPMFPHGVGVMLCTERLEDRWPAHVVSPVGIYDCAGARDPEAEAQVRRLLAPGAGEKIHTLCLARHQKGDGCLVHVEGFCLQS